MKNSYLFFMLLILLMNCVNTEKINYDFEEQAKTYDLLYSLIFINKMKKEVKPVKTDDCRVDCIEFSKNYTFVDVNWNEPNCTDLYINGNGNNSPESSEQGILRIPISYNGNLKISNISVKLYSLDNQIIIDRQIIKYPDLKLVKDFQYACPSTYYENWNYSEKVNCVPDYISQCSGWKIKIPNNYQGNFLFKILFSSSIGDKYFDYSL